MSATDRPWSALRLWRGTPEIVEFLAAHGLDASKVRIVQIEDDVVVAEVFDLDDQGRVHVRPGSTEVATHTEQTPLVHPFDPLKRHA
jgi:hypothetical protein